MTLKRGKVKLQFTVAAITLVALLALRQTDTENRIETPDTLAKQLDQAPSGTVMQVKIPR